MKIGSLCTGYGGLDLAAEAYFDAETIWCAEFDKYASQVIEQRFNIPNYGDIKQIDWASLPTIDILTAGYPCQPFSNAGQRKGTDDPRHIWPHIKEAISILRPSIVIMENVRGHITLGFKEVLQGLTEIGYDAKWELIRASDVGAPHRRERLFVIAYPANAYGYTRKKSRRADRSVHGTTGKVIDRSNRNEYGLSIENLGDTNNKHKPYDGQMQELGRRFASRREMRLRRAPNPLDLGKLNPKFVEYMMGLNDGWVTDTGLSRAQQLKMLGNGVVPQQAEYAIHRLCTGGDNEL